MIVRDSTILLRGRRVRISRKLTIALVKFTRMNLEIKMRGNMVKLIRMGSRNPERKFKG